MDNVCTGTSSGWEKYSGNPVLGGEYGTCFDLSILQTRDGYKMYFSWRPQHSIAVSESTDGYIWSEPKFCIRPRETEEGWEDELNRPCVVYRDNMYHMWYTGQFLPGEKEGSSHIFYATSQDGITFTRFQSTPVITPTEKWEKDSVMCPDVAWDENEGVFKIWYSGGEQYEPNAIGYAVSKDGISWEKASVNPVFQSNPANSWEQHKAAGCHVEKANGWYYMFYIGYHTDNYAQIGLARSKNGFSDWERHPQNPIIAPDPKTFDEEACYKPYTIYNSEKNQWMLWYNGRQSDWKEQIGIAVHSGFDLGFDQ